jgi:hypothetical protein
MKSFEIGACASVIILIICYVIYTSFRLAKEKAKISSMEATDVEKETAITTHSLSDDELKRVVADDLKKARSGISGSTK